MQWWCDYLIMQLIVLNCVFLWLSNAHVWSTCLGMGLIISRLYIIPRIMAHQTAAQ